MRKFLYTSLLTILLATIGCGKSDNNGNSPIINNPLVHGGLCMPGQVQTEFGICLNQYGCDPGYGFNGSSCVPGDVVAPEDIYEEKIHSKYGATMVITHRGRFEKFLEHVGGVCNSSSYFSSHNCESLSNNGFVYIDLFYNSISDTAADSYPAYVTIGAGSDSPLDGMYGGHRYKTVPLNLQIESINDGEGFELKGNGGYFGGYTSGLESSITLRVSKGKPGSDDNFQVTLLFNDAVFAKAFVSRQ